MAMSALDQSQRPRPEAPWPLGPRLCPGGLPTRWKPWLGGPSLEACRIKGPGDPSPPWMPWPGGPGLGAKCIGCKILIVALSLDNQHPSFSSIDRSILQPYKIKSAKDLLRGIEALRPGKGSRKYGCD